MRHENYSSYARHALLHPSPYDICVPARVGTWPSGPGPVLPVQSYHMTMGATIIDAACSSACILFRHRYFALAPRWTLDAHSLFTFVLRYHSLLHQVVFRCAFLRQDGLSALSSWSNLSVPSFAPGASWLIKTAHRDMFQVSSTYVHLLRSTTLHFPPSSRSDIPSDRRISEDDRLEGSPNSYLLAQCAIFCFAWIFVLL